MHGKFGKHFAHGHDSGEWEGWTPPWMQRDWQEGPHGPRAWGGFPGPGARFFGPRGPFGPFGPFGPRGPFGQGWQGPGPEVQALWSEAAEVGRLFAIAGRSAFENKERVAQLHNLLERTRKELTDMIYKTGQSQPDSERNASEAEQA